MGLHFDINPVADPTSNIAIAAGQRRIFQLLFLENIKGLKLLKSLCFGK
jgi:hypothetical protein